MCCSSREVNIGQKFRNSDFALLKKKNKHKFTSKTKAWNQNMESHDVILHKMYTDFKGPDLEVPCNIKYKTDKLKEVIDLHKLEVIKDFIQHCDLDLSTEWDDDPKQHGCESIMTLIERDSKKKVLTTFFFQSGVVVCQGELLKDYGELIFPKVMEQLEVQIQDVPEPVKKIQEELVKATLASQETPVNARVGLTKDKINLTGKTLSNHLQKLRDTPITPQNIINNHLIRSENRIDKLEDSIMEIMNNQSVQFEAWSKLFELQSNIITNQVDELNKNFSASHLEALIANKVKEEIAKQSGDVHKKNGLSSPSELEGQSLRIQELEEVIRAKNDVIEKLNEEIISLKIQVEELEQLENNKDQMDQAIPTIAIFNPNLHGEEDVLADNKTFSVHTNDFERNSVDECLSYEDSDHASLVGSSGSKEFSSTQENDRKDDITIPISKLNKILEELDDLKKIKESRDGNWQFKPIRTRKNVELFGDSFLKYVEEEKCFGKQSHVNINAWFTT